MKGFLAFDGEKCIGWCNANNINAYPRIDLNKYIENKIIGCVICYVIHPQYRGCDIARELLKMATFKKDHYDGVIALPIDITDYPEKQYRGTLNMYKENGFIEISRQGDTHIMLLQYSKP